MKTRELVVIENIKKYMFITGMNAKQLAQEVGITPTHLSYVLNQKRIPSHELLENIADVFHVPVTRLTGEAASAIIEERIEKINMSLADVAEKANVPLTWLQNLDSFIPGQDDIEPGSGHELEWDAVIGEYKSYEWITRVAKVIGLPSAMLRAALACQEAPIYQGPISSPEEDFGVIHIDHVMPTFEFNSEFLRRIPLVGKVAAGDPALAIENTNEFIVIDTRINRINGNEINDYFALEVVGHSMEPTVHAGEIVLVKKAPIIELGEIGVFRCNGDEATIKRLAREGSKVYLVPDNKQYPVQEYSNECECVGKVIESIRRKIK